MITIYHVPRTRSARVIWLCEEFGLPYEVVPVDFQSDYRKSPEWRPSRRLLRTATTCWATS